MPADTPAPSALDALLREVDDLNARGVFPEGFVQAPSGEYVPLKSKDARLAAIVRVLREKASALVAAARVDGVATTRFVLDALDELDAALARAEALAKGE